MPIVPRIQHDRDEAQRVARRAVIDRPIAASVFVGDFLEQIQEQEDQLRWLLNSRPRKMKRGPRFQKG